MDRLPADRTFEQLLERGEIGGEDIARLARLVARFHREGNCTPEIAEGASWAVVERNHRENFEQIQNAIGTTISATVYHRLKRRTEETLRELKPLIEKRADAGIPRDTHGDLHLDHVYSLPREGAEDEFVIIDCIEFNTRFRYADPVSDIAFLAMDLAFHGHADLAKIAADAYFESSGDADGRRLLDLYAAYRAVVRGKVEGLAVGETEVPEKDRQRLLRRARAHFLLALRYLSPPSERPALVLVAGLPGSGKSVLCRNLEASAGMARLDSDRVRKELAGLSPDEPAAAEWGRGIYTVEWNDRTYAGLRERAEALLFEGRRVVVEASFCEERRRLPFVEMARSLAVPCFFMECRAGETTVRDRLSRRSGDVSDAGIEVYELAKQHWEPPGERISGLHHVISTEGEPEETLKSAMRMIQEAGLA
jgi:hypothetical protein